jgi:hypothetical protein
MESSFLFFFWLAVCTLTIHFFGVELKMSITQKNSNFKKNMSIKFEKKSAFAPEEVHSSKSRFVNISISDYVCIF